MSTLEQLIADLRVCARATRSSSWPGEMAHDMEQRANRVDIHADRLQERLEGKAAVNKDHLLRVGDATGGWTTKADARQTGCSIHFKFENKVPVHTAMEFITIIEEAPGMLTNALRLLLNEEQVTS